MESEVQLIQFNEGENINLHGLKKLCNAAGLIGAMDMVWEAFWCLVWQAVLALIANAAIWAVTFFRPFLLGLSGRFCSASLKRLRPKMLMITEQS